MSNTDLGTIDMLRDTDGQFVTGIGEKVFGNLPKVGRTLVPTGMAYLVAWRQARLFIR